MPKGHAYINALRLIIGFLSSIFVSMSAAYAQDASKQSIGKLALLSPVVSFQLNKLEVKKSPATLPLTGFKQELVKFEKSYSEGEVSHSQQLDTVLDGYRDITKELDKMDDVDSVTKAEWLRDDMALKNAYLTSARGIVGFKNSMLVKVAVETKNKEGALVNGYLIFSHPRGLPQKNGWMFVFSDMTNNAFGDLPPGNYYFKAERNNKIAAEGVYSVGVGGGKEEIKTLMVED